MSFIQKKEGALKEPVAQLGIVADRDDDSQECPDDMVQACSILQKDTVKTLFCAIIWMVVAANITEQHRGNQEFFLVIPEININIHHPNQQRVGE